MNDELEGQDMKKEDVENDVGDNNSVINEAIVENVWRNN